MYENVHPNLALVLLFGHTKVECEKGLFELLGQLAESFFEAKLLNTAL